MAQKTVTQTWGIAGLALACGIAATAAERLQAAPPTGATTKAKVDKAAPVSAAAPLTEEQRIVHALNRMGFGPRPGDVEKVRDTGLANYIDQQLHPERIDDSVVDRKLAAFTTLNLSGDDLARLYLERQQNQKKVREQAQAMTGADKNIPANSGMQAGQGAMADGMGNLTAAAAPNADNAANLRARLLANATPEQRLQLREMYANVAKSAQAVADVQRQTAIAKTVRAVESERQLQEVLVDFWGNHFNIDTQKQACATLKAADDRDVIRAHALGKFRDLLEASAKSPAMLVYLDNYQSTTPLNTGGALGQAIRRRFANGNAQGMAAGATAMRQRLGAVAPQAKNKKSVGGLNENYGREIMELHTLGVDGGYSQKDVTEVARCFTGWGLSRNASAGVSANPAAAARRYGLGGSFQFHPFLHDNGVKTVLGRTIPAGGGMGDGETVLDILASNPATMRHVSTQLCQRFVADTPPPALVDKCVAAWKRTDGDIREIMRTILTSPEFFSRAAYGKKIKSPFEYAISSVRALGGTCEVTASNQTPLRRPGKKGQGLYGTDTLLGQIGTMGQPVFQYQAPTGYPEDSHKWVSAGALISRLNFSLALSGGKLEQVKLPDWDQDVTGLTGPMQIVDRLSSRLLHGPISASTRATLLAQVNGSASATGDAHAAVADLSLTHRLTALLLGSPEFQRR